MTNSTHTIIEQLIWQLEITQSCLLPGYSEVIRQVDETIAKARAILAAEPPAPDPRETIAVRPLLEEVVALDVWGVELYDGRQAALQQRIKAWLAENPPGQPVAIEPRGCPTPGACSCVEPPAPTPAADGASSPTPEELAQWLDGEARSCAAQFHDRITRAAALLREAVAVDQKTKELITAVQATYSAYGWVPEKHFIRLFDDVARLASALEEGCDCSIQKPLNWETEILELKARPRPVPVAERPWERPGWCDAEGFLWLWDSDRRWVRQTGTAGACNTWTGSFALPHWAIPQPPQDGEVGE